MTGILNVDLLAFEQGGSVDRAATVDGVMQSLRTGFVYTKHDISEGLLDEAYEVLEKFFALSTEAKEDYFAHGSKGQSGYTGLLVETAAVSDTPDWKEMFNWGAALPSGHPLRDRYPHRYGEPIFPSDRIPGADRILSAFHEHLVQLQTRFLRIIAVGIGAHEHFFDTMLEHGSHLTRAIRYPPMSEAPNAGREGHVWAEEHSDINLITALPRATARGLQVKVDEEWIDATPPDQHVIINTGIMLERLTNGLIPVGWHRVIADPQQSDGRLSVVQFCHPTPWTILSPVPSSVTAERPCQYPAMSAGDCLDQVLWEINLSDG
ncbi:MAG TPA: isopenicillin N synthase family oxygenase [Acidimicrobiia bacterium]|jgi:isopenicillin N synthase-like dioxygenase|nr:isopenicillin N synthase family oxygenase [Acidimicrobiia bacterium]